VNAETTLMIHSQLVQALTDACTAAIRAGMSPGEVSVTLQRIQELVEQGDDA
jgi:hypothetical protein